MHGARGIGLRADCAERGAGRAQAGRAESRPVGAVERLDADLQILLLRERKILAHRHIHVLGHIPAQVAELCVESPDVARELLAGRGVEARGVERDAVGLALLQVERTAQVNHIAPGRQHRTCLQRQHHIEFPSAHQSIAEARSEVEALVAADGQFVRCGEDVAQWPRIAGDALFRRGIGIVEVRQPVDQFTVDEVIDQREPVGEPLLQPHIETLEVGAARRVAEHHNAIAG